MKKYLSPAFILVLYSLFCTATLTQAADSSTAHYWYNGKEKTPLVLDSQRWIEFATPQTPKTSTSQETVAKQILLEKNYGHAKIYNLTKNPIQSKNSVDAISLKIDAQKNAPRYSEIFSDKGQIKALPGGIIVAFKSYWDEEKIRQWTEEQNLLLERVLIKSINLWLIHSASGIEALELANRITEQGEVEYAMPNWWRPAVAK